MCPLRALLGFRHEAQRLRTSGPMVRVVGSSTGRYLQHTLDGQVHVSLSARTNTHQSVKHTPRGQFACADRPKDRVLCDQRVNVVQTKSPQHHVAYRVTSCTAYHELPLALRSLYFYGVPGIDPSSAKKSRGSPMGRLHPILSSIRKARGKPSTRLPATTNH